MFSSVGICRFTTCKLRNERRILLNTLLSSAFATLELQERPNTGRYLKTAILVLRLAGQNTEETSQRMEGVNTLPRIFFFKMYLASHLSIPYTYIFME